MRDRSIDIGKGLAILFVYLGHCILYHPIQMNTIPWCHTLDLFIVSFNLPMFFLISGYLFSKTKKNTAELYKGKTLRLFIPYLATMAVIICMKLVLPMEMSYNEAVNGGARSMIINTLCYGGDRWFVYTLYVSFLLLIPIKKALNYKWLDFVLIIALIIIYYLNFLPTIFKLNKVFYYMVFIIIGYLIGDYYDKIKTWSLKFWWLIYVVFLVTNILFIELLREMSFLYRFILPIIGTLAMMTMAFQLGKVIEKSKIAQYIEYCGKYSLQFYLFSFCYPFIRWGIVNVMHITNPVIILLSVFVLQLITITIIVEITRRIKWLKIPCGY